MPKEVSTNVLDDDDPITQLLDEQADTVILKGRAVHSSAETQVITGQTETMVTGDCKLIRTEEACRLGAVFEVPDIASDENSRKVTVLNALPLFGSNLEDGLSVQEVAQQTGLSTTVVNATLEALSELLFVAEREGRYTQNGNAQRFLKRFERT